MMTKTHYFVMLEKSPWPFLTSVGLMNTAFSAISWLKTNSSINFVMSLALLSIISMNWWLTMKSDLNKKGSNTEKMEETYKSSMILFISSEILFFFSMFWGYQHYNLVPMMDVGSIWPPLNTKMFDPSGIPMLNTLILLSSGMTVTMAHKAMMDKENKKFVMFKLLTIMLGMTFSILQLQEYGNSFFSMSDSSFGSTFFILTGFHGLHVLIGTVFILTNWCNFLFLSNSKETLSFEMAAWYWHFVDVVWLIVFYMLYYLNN